MAAWRGDDQERFELFFRAFYPAVFAYVLRRASRPVAEEVAADVFVVAWRRRSELPPEPLPWLYGVARHVLANSRRGARRRGALLAKLTSRMPSQNAVEEPVVHDELTGAFARITESEREVLRLAVWEELSSAEAAEALGISPAAFRVRLHRARRHLVEALEASARGLEVELSKQRSRRRTGVS